MTIKNASLFLISILGILMISVFLRKENTTLFGTGGREVVEEKVYVALEGEGKVAVLDPMQKKVITTIDLSDHTQPSVRYMAHNVQVAPDGNSVWVTANAMDAKDMESGHMEGKKTESLDQVMVIDPQIDKVIKRIAIAHDSHLAHVVISPDATKAYVTAQEKGVLYIIHTETAKVERVIDLGKKSGPHGLRVSPDGKNVFIAFVDGMALTVLDTTTERVQIYPFESGTVQTAVTPDGRFTFATLYTTKQIVRLEITTGRMELFDLPKEAKGPVQIYPTPDSRFIYIADQGYYFNQPVGNTVYRMSVEHGFVDQTITTGAAPHGIVVDPFGTTAYVTNLISNDVSMIDILTGKETARIPVGNMPNGISLWHRTKGGMP